MAYSCVPFDPEWSKDGCPDVKAIYLRPRRDEYQQPILSADGTPAWDVTTPLPIRRHADYLAKGFRYLTLASNGDLMDGAVLSSLRRRGLDPASFLNGPGKRVWDWKLWQQQADQQAAQDATDLEALVREFGSEAVLKIKRQSDPAYELPERLRGRKAVTAKGAAA
jgi:hypothetical protein